MRFIFKGDGSLQIAIAYITTDGGLSMGVLFESVSYCDYSIYGTYCIYIW